MDLARLQAFRDVARLGSLAAAARAIGSDPSAVSRSISTLEAELGIRLFQRTTRRLELTEAGEIYLRRIEPLIDELAAAQEAALGLVERPRGRLRVTASSAYGQSAIAPLLRSFHAVYPDVQLELILTDDVIDLVAERIDLAVRLGPTPTGDMIVSRLATTLKRLVASPDYLRAAPPIDTPEAIANHACLVSPSEGPQSTWLFRRGNDEVAVPVIGTVNTRNTLVLRRCALDGIGLSILADWLVDTDIAEGRLVEVLADWTAAAADFETGVWMVYPSRRFLPLKARAFIDHLRKHLG